MKCTLRHIKNASLHKFAKRIYFIATSLLHICVANTSFTSFEGGDGVEFHEYEVTYQIETKYEYNGKLYNYAFYVDSLTENSSEPYCIGKKISIQIDSKNPEYVFAGNPGNFYRVVGYIIGAILVVIMFFWLLIKFFPDYLFSLPFLIGAIMSFCAGISMIILGEVFGYLLTFLIAPVFTGVSFLFFKLSKMKQELYYTKEKFTMN